MGEKDMPLKHVPQVDDQGAGDGLHMLPMASCVDLEPWAVISGKHSQCTIVCVGTCSIHPLHQRTFMCPQEVSFSGSSGMQAGVCHLSLCRVILQYETHRLGHSSVHMLQGHAVRKQLQDLIGSLCRFVPWCVEGRRVVTSSGSDT